MERDRDREIERQRGTERETVRDRDRDTERDGGGGGGGRDTHRVSKSDRKCKHTYVSQVQSIRIQNKLTLIITHSHYTRLQNTQI